MGLCGPKALVKSGGVVVVVRQLLSCNVLFPPPTASRAIAIILHNFVFSQSTWLHYCIFASASGARLLLLVCVGVE